MNKLKYFIQRKTDQPLWLFFGLWMLTALVYLIAFKGGFYEDFVGFLEDCRKQSYVEFVMQSGHAMYFGVNTVQYFFIYLFGQNPIPWFLLFTGLHALNAAVQVRFFKDLFRFWEFKDSKWIILTGTLFWLLTPLAVEPVNWKACSHYMCSMIMMFTILSWFVRYLQEPKTNRLLGIFFVYALSAVFLEFFYLTPVFALIILISAGYCGKLEKGTTLRVILKVFIPMLLVWCLYYLLLQQLTGRLYDRVQVKSADILDPIIVSGRLGKYIVHIYFMEYFLPGNAKQSIYRTISTPVVAGFIGVLIGFLMLWGFLRLRRATPHSRILAVLFLLFISSFIVILPMWFYDTFSYQGSRYYYLAGVFGYMILSCIIFRMPVALWLRRAVAGAYLCCCIAGTLYLVKNVRDTERILSNLDESFRWGDQDQVFLLNLPIYYRGIGLIGAADGSNFTYHLDILKNRKIRAKVYDVSSFNMAGRWDGAHVQVLDKMIVKVCLNQGGTWWWYKFQGATDYENDLYKITFVNNGANYLIEFKKPITPRTSILFQSGGYWKEVDMSKEGEQW